MSKIVYAYHRTEKNHKRLSKKLDIICSELTPDNISTPENHRIFVDSKTAYAVTLDKSTIVESEKSLLLGHLYEPNDVNWSAPARNYPDGNFVIVRTDSQLLEVVCDGAGSRTIWYYFDQEQLIISTSQRAVILFLESFDFDDRIIPWMLSSGTLGPEYSWDKRVRRIEPDSSILLNKKKWELSHRQNSIAFSEAKRTREEHLFVLMKSIRKTMNDLDSIDLKKWVLPLSGGYDSRAILTFLIENDRAINELQTITWGLENSLSDEQNDAFIAKKLSQTIGVSNKYYNTDLSSESMYKILDRFLVCSEGRIDHFAGYMDGMEIWKKLYEDDFVGIIRGDEGFGWNSVTSQRSVRFSIGCALCSDFKNLQQVISKYQLPQQELSQNLTKGEHESLSTWRDRLYHVYRIPIRLAALSDIKFSYVEVINPLISKSILETVRTLPDTLRTDKYLFKEIVTSMSPDIPYASKSATADPEKILMGNSMIRLLQDVITSNDAKKVFRADFLQFIVDGFDDRKQILKKKTIKKTIGSLTPAFIKKWAGNRGTLPSVPSITLAFRVFLIIKMYRMLSDDSRKCR